MELILALILGAAFGFALYFVGAATPKKLLSMLRLEDLSLMKIIFAAIGFASVLLALSIQIGIFDLSHIHVKSMNLGVIAGGLIFGIGFGSIGTCPGTCVAASGTRELKRAIAAVAGGLLGAFAFSMSYGWWKSAGLFDTLDFGKITWFKLSDNFSSVFPIGAAGLLVTGMAFIAAAYFIPFQGRKTK